MTLVVAGVTGGMGSLILADIAKRGEYQRRAIAHLILIDFFGSDPAKQDAARQKLVSSCRSGKKGSSSSSSAAAVTAVHWDASSAQSTDDVCRTVSSLVVANAKAAPLLGLLVTTGIGFHGDVSKMSLADSQSVLARQLAVNCVGPAMLCQEMAKLMPPAPNGFVPTMLVVSSFSGLVGLPHRAHYCSSKFALNGFMEGLHAAYSDSIRMVLVCPTSVSTPFRENWKKEQQQSAGNGAAVEAPEMNKADLTPEQCVAGILSAWNEGSVRPGLEYVVLPGGKTSVAAWAVRLPGVRRAVRKAVLNKSKM